VLARRAGRDCTRICTGGRTHARPPLPAETPRSLDGPMSLASAGKVIGSGTYDALLKYSEAFRRNAGRR
jgi:hypothetical protein